MRWPPAWRDPSNLSFIRKTCINYLFFENQTEMEPVVAAAKQAGVQVGQAAPTGVSLVKGLWPGIQLTRLGKEGEADAGPTGEPWVDSNGWRILLEMAKKPHAQVWVDAAPPAEGVPLGSYLIAMADAATYQGRWILTLAPAFASEIASGNREAVGSWKQITNACEFFCSPKPWAHDIPAALLGVISDFSGANESLSQELLNMLSRANQQYRVILKNSASAATLHGLRGIAYVDVDPPGPDLRTQMLAFVEAGGLLVTKPEWHPLPSNKAWKTDEHPRFSIGSMGKGRVAVAKEDPSDPYLLANDVVTLISRRWDLLRFWNFGPIGARLTISADRRRATAQIVSYAEPDVYGPTLGVSLAYRRAKLWRYDLAGSSNLEMARQNTGTEIHLPPFSVYGAVELEA
jgi:hypothetical protein